MQLSQQVSLFDADFRDVVEVVHQTVAAVLRVLFIHRGQFVLCGFEHGWRLLGIVFSELLGAGSIPHSRGFCPRRVLTRLRRCGRGFDWLTKVSFALRSESGRCDSSGFSHGTLISWRA